MSSPRWMYHGGRHDEQRAVRTFRSDDGLLGKIVRTRKTKRGDWGEGQVAYFVWALPDSAPEYATVEEAYAACPPPKEDADANHPDPGGDSPA